MGCGDLKTEEKKDKYVEERNCHFSVGPLVENTSLLLPEFVAHELTLE
jgi:hypothetical protein